MAPAASTTDVCPHRAAHGAFAVRRVQVIPAADARAPGRWHRTQPRARGRKARRGPSYLYRKSPPCDGRARSDAAHAHAESESDENAHTHACALTQARIDAQTRARTDTRERTQMNTNTQTSTRTNARVHCTHAQKHPHMHLHLRTPSGTQPTLGTPLVPPRYPKYPHSTPGIPRKPRENSAIHRVATASAPHRYRVGTASAPRRYRACALPSTR
jgi:hypothetical protein